MPLSPELLQMLMEDEEVAPRFGGGPDVGYPSFRPEDLREADEPALSFPVQANERSSFGSRFLDTFADSPTNYQTGPGQSPLMIALASAMNSGSRGLQQRRLRERENSPSNPANKLSLARLNSANAKTRLEQKRYAATEARATRNERRADRTLARLEAGAEKVAAPPDYSKPQPGETQAAFRDRQLREMRENANATRAPKSDSGSQPTVIQNPDGSTTIFPGGGKVPVTKEREWIAENATLIGQIGAIRSEFKPEFVGPLNAVRGAAGTKFGGRLLRAGEAKFRANLANYRNRVISNLSGANVPIHEMERMKQELPTEENPPEVFEAKVLQTEKNLRDAAMYYRRTLSETGVNLGGLSPLPASADSSGYKMVDGIRVRAR